MRRRPILSTTIATSMLLVAACIGPGDAKNRPEIAGHAEQSQQRPKAGNMRGNPVEMEISKGVSVPNGFPMEDPGRIIADFQTWQEVQKALKRKDSRDLILGFIASGANAMTLAAFKQLIVDAANDEDWATFEMAMSNMRKFDIGDDKAPRCAIELYKITTTKSVSVMAKDLATSNEKLPKVCDSLIAASAYTGAVPIKDSFRRILIMISNGQVAEAQNLAARIGADWNDGQIADPVTESFKKDVKALIGIITPKGRNTARADEKLRGIDASLNPERSQFAHGILALSYARDLNSAKAVSYFDMSNPMMLSDEQFEWWARSALRIGDFRKLAHVIGLMPQNLKRSATWSYWMGRALESMGDARGASENYHRAKATGRNFYAILATEALGGRVEVRNNNAGYSGAEIDKVARDGRIHRALVLFNQSLESGDKKMRTEAQKQWRYATKDYNERTLLASSVLALRNHFYEMAIYSADKPHHLLDYNLRFPYPFKDKVDYWSKVNGVEAAWVYGVIRQESRFMTLASSRVGASGLMQIMPGTARLIARKIGLSSYEINDLDHNIQMGTWYLGDIRNNLGHEILATAGYNAGPNRAIKWQANFPMEGAIYAETIPFNETRDYVKKVMSNTTYYEIIFGNKNFSLKNHLGNVPAYHKYENQKSFF